MEKKYPKVLVVSRVVWDDSIGTSSTLSNLFSEYPAKQVAHIYIDPKLPATKRCSRFFQISEYNLIRHIFNWKTKTGQEVSNHEVTIKNESESAIKEERILSFVRGHRWHFFNILREVLWGFNGWKSKELKDYINDVNPDIIWLDGVFDIFLSRVYLHVLHISQKPCVLFLMDDNYTYQSVVGCAYITRFFLRRQIKRIVRESKRLFVISPKMKREFDKEFGVNSIVITKGIDYNNLSYHKPAVGNPVRIVYMGQIIYGRLKTIQMLGKQLDIINKDGLKIQLHIYTNNHIKESDKQKLTEKGSVIFEKPVPYSQVGSILEKSDVLLFVESLDKKYNKKARLSFSTKITDYFESGKCVLAIGPADSASLEYLRVENAALVVNEEQGIYDALQRICKSDAVQLFSLKAFECGKRNHDLHIISQKINNAFQEVVKENNNCIE